jgi:hypothetical protein
LQCAIAQSKNHSQQKLLPFNFTHAFCPFSPPLIDNHAPIAQQETMAYFCPNYHPVLSGPVCVAYLCTAAIRKAKPTKKLSRIG